jgi:hypothetical protein
MSNFDTGDGRMSALLASGGRPLLTIPDPIGAPAAERADAFATFIAYAGTYTLGDAKVIHHVEISSLQNWVGTEQIRFRKLEGNRLKFCAQPDTIGGLQMVAELVWER